MAEGTAKIESEVCSVENILPQVDNTPLGDDDFFDVKKALTHVTAKWKSVGAGLRLKSSKLNEIGVAHPGNPAECLSDVVSAWLNKEYNWKRFGEPTWRRVVEVVADAAAGGNPAAALSIAEKHRAVPTNVVAVEKSRAQETVFGTPRSHTVKLKAQLESLKAFSGKRQNSADYKLGLLQEAIQDFIENSLSSGASKETVEQELQELYSKDLLVSNEMYQWALKELESSVPATSCPTVTTTATDDSDGMVPPLFCKDTLYHASLCCYAVSTCNAATYERFFNKDYPSHSLKEISLSRSEDREDVDRYLIARQGTTYYVAFQSEPQLSKWSEKFSSFQEGIKIQSKRIPLRFFVQLVNEGHRIVFTGFSFGGLLALSVSAMLWELPLLSMEILKENITCITFGHPLLSLPYVVDVVQETPEFEALVHSVCFEEDCAPRVMSFLDTECDRLDVTLGMEAYKPLQGLNNGFQGSFTSALLHHLSCIQDASIDVAETTEPLSKAKKLLKDAVSKMLLTNGSKNPIVLGTAYQIRSDPVQGLTWTQAIKQQREMGWLKPEAIESLTCSLFQKHNMDVYHRSVLRSHLDHSPRYRIPASIQQEISELKHLKPFAQAVAFRRHGNELAVVVTGDNLWFCHNLRVGSHKEKVEAGDVSRKSVQFNCGLDTEDLGFSADSDQVKVQLESHFYNPVKTRVPVTRKAYQFTFRQEQLAKLTPSELIEVAYLGSLLEQQPRGRMDHFSGRFDTLRNFFEQVVLIVPFESLVHTIAHIGGLKAAAKCCDALMAYGYDIPPSVALVQSCQDAYVRMLRLAESPLQYDNIEDENYLIATLKGSGLAPKLAKRGAERWYKMYQSIKSRDSRASKQREQESAYQKKLDKQTFAYQVYTHAGLPYATRYSMLTEHSSHPFSDKLVFLATVGYQSSTNVDQQHPAVCEMSLQHIYPVDAARSSAVQGDGTHANSDRLQPPLEILRAGRKKLHWLADRALTTPEFEAVDEVSASGETKRSSLSALYNARMLKIVRDIREGELKICISLLAAFMADQIQVPLIKSSIDTAKRLNRVLTKAAVGVWALFSLNRGDLESIISSIPAGSLNVEVQKYIRGIFKQDSLSSLADEQYAGKLQFMVQGLEKTVSCNSHYISYSLERQLVELCKNLKIDSSTPLQKLTSEWDTVFKDDVLALVALTHRSLIARWLKWALMVHHLREELAKYTAVGVVGLVNSGKSLLVSTLFKLRVPVGTTELKRTTVPFLYNLGDDVEGLDVIDFPGVDDRDETIPDLADLLLALAQIVIFVVDYRKVHTESAKKWLERLEEEPVPVLVCLTFADKLYANECMGVDGSHPPPEDARRKIAQELSWVEDKLGRIPSRTIRYFSFCQDRDSCLNQPEGRRVLRDVGIGGPQDVGEWLTEVFKNKLDQPALGDQLHDFIHAGDSQS